MKSGEIFGEALGASIAAHIKSSRTLQTQAVSQFDPFEVLARWPPGLVAGLLKAVCPEPMKLQAPALHRKGLHVFSALEVLSHAQSQKHNLLQAVTSEVRVEA